MLYHKVDLAAALEQGQSGKEDGVAAMPVHSPRKDVAPAVAAFTRGPVRQKVLAYRRLSILTWQLEARRRY